MKKRLTFITFLMLFCSTVFGQSHWGNVPDYGYESNMNLYGTVQINGVDQTRADLELAAFCGEELRGVTQPKKLGNKYVFLFTIVGKEDYEIIKFKLYDPIADAELGSEYTIKYIPDGSVGSYGNYIPVNFVPMYWDESEIVTYEHNMVVNALITIDGELQDRGDLELAAFCGDELRDIARPIYFPTPQKFITTFDIEGKNADRITFKLYDHSGNILSESLPLTADNSVDFENGKIIGQNPPITLNFVYQSVAKVGETYYTTLAAAVEAATEENNTVTLLRDAEGSGVVIDKDVTIDFGGFTYTFTSPAVGSDGTESNGFQILNGNTVTLQNGALNVAESAKEDFYILIQNYANLNVTGMTLDGTYLDKWIADYSDSYVLSNNSGEVKISNSTIIANNDGTKSFAFDACKYASYKAPVVTLGENVTVNGKVELSGGELYANAVLTVVAKKSFKKVTGEVGATEGWGTISTPIANVEIPSNDNHDIYSYDEKNAMWRFYKEGEGVETHFTEFELGQGYLYANTSDITIELEGLLNTQPVSMQISNTEAMGALAGFNFVGNPFAHNISEAHFATTGDAQLSNGFYVVSPKGGIVVRPANAVIAPMESVMVQTNAETTLTINNVAPASKRSAVNNGRLEITVANANYSDVAYVSFNEGRGLNKIGHRNVEIPMVYIPVDGANYAIAMMNQDVTEIPVSFQAATMGQYTIGVEAQDCEYAMMTLVDRFTGIETNLLIEDYTFIAKSNDSAERFIIKLAMNNSNGEANENFAFINNGMMYIYNIEGQGMVNVYDVTGRPVAEYNVATSANISTSDFAAGMYIIRMSDENGVKVQKIVVE